MFAAIPFFELNVWRPEVPGVGEVPIDPWATLVCLGFVVGLEIARNRAIKLGMEVRDIVDGAVFIVLSGFAMAHVVTVVFYYPERLQTDGIWAILRFWEGFASTGGFIGAVLGTWVFYKLIRPRQVLRHADIICYGFPFGWFFGRVGCGVVHDHIGALTTFPLAMDFDRGFWIWTEGARYATGIRHELGLYEALYMIPMCWLFWQWGKQDRVPGFFLAWFGILYAPARFVLDFLRNVDLNHQDARYFGLTPAQYGMIIMFGAAIWFLRTRDTEGFRPHPLDGSAPLPTLPDGGAPPEPSEEQPEA